MPDPKTTYNALMLLASDFVGDPFGAELRRLGFVDDSDRTLVRQGETRETFEGVSAWQGHDDPDYLDQELDDVIRKQPGQRVVVSPGVYRTRVPEIVGHFSHVLDAARTVHWMCSRFWAPDLSSMARLIGVPDFVKNIRQLWEEEQRARSE